MKISKYLKNMKVENVSVKTLVPYENNARRNEDAVPGVAASIRKFGFRNPILVDKDNVIIEGHTRRLAAISLGMEEVPVIRVTDLPQKMVAALRLADNKLSELSSWDFDKLDKELAAIAEMDGDDLDMGELGFPSLDDDPFASLDTAPADGGAAQAASAPGVAVATADGNAAAVAGVAGTLPPELAGAKLTPDAQEKIEIEAPTNKDRVIVVFNPEDRPKLVALFGFVPDKVVYTLEEVLAANGDRGVSDKADKGKADAKKDRGGKGDRPAKKDGE